MKSLLAHNPVTLGAVILASFLSSLVGAVVLFGWYSQNPALIQINPAFVPMQFNTALGFLLSGIGLGALALGRLRLASLAGLLVATLGGGTLLEYVLDVNLGLDGLFMEHFIQVKTSHPGRMAPNTALCFFSLESLLA